MRGIRARPKGPLAKRSEARTPNRGVRRPLSSKTKKSSQTTAQILLAEREGFEPPVPLSTVVFKTTVIDHSTISPVL